MALGRVLGVGITAVSERLSAGRQEERAPKNRVHSGKNQGILLC